MTVALIGVAVLLVSIVLWREAHQQHRDATVAAALTRKADTAEIVLVLRGGPCDGGRIRVSPSVARLMRADNPLLIKSGEYVLESVVMMPDGGGVWTYQWHVAA